MPTTRYAPRTNENSRPAVTIGSVAKKRMLRSAARLAERDRRADHDHHREVEAEVERQPERRERAQEVPGEADRRVVARSRGSRGAARPTTCCPSPTSAVITPFTIMIVITPSRSRASSGRSHTITAMSTQKNPILSPSSAWVPRTIAAEMQRDAEVGEERLHDLRQRIVRPRLADDAQHGPDERVERERLLPSRRNRQDRRRDPSTARARRAAARRAAVVARSRVRPAPRAAATRMMRRVRDELIHERVEERPRQDDRRRSCTPTARRRPRRRASAVGAPGPASGSAARAWPRQGTAARCTTACTESAKSALTLPRRGSGRSPARPAHELVEDPHRRARRRRARATRTAAASPRCTTPTSC